MSEMPSESIGAGARPGGLGARPTIVRGVTPIGRRISRLEARVDELEVDLAEARRLNLRLAELMDVVEELLVPMAQRDDARVSAFLESHHAPL
jgi:hypothetical protein